MFITVYMKEKKDNLVLNRETYLLWQLKFANQQRGSFQKLKIVSYNTQNKRTEIQATVDVI